MTGGTSSGADKIQQAIACWRQGDYVLGPQEFVYVGEPSGEIVAETVDGLAVLSQTCDIVRNRTDRPYVEVAPLVRVPSEHLKEIQKFQRPRYAYLQALETQQLVVDLDRVMTVDKTLLATWQRQPGCGNDAETRDFAFALGRKRTRFAFPDDFNAWIRRAESIFKKKHGKQSAEGRALDSLEEIRVRISPDWQEELVTVQFLFVVPPGASYDWEKLCEKWHSALDESPRYHPIQPFAVSLDQLSALVYRQSIPLDLDYLSLA